MSCPIFSSTVNFRSVVSTHAFAAGDNFLIPLFAGTTSSLAMGFLVKVLRLWLRALWAIRRTIETGIRSKKRTRRPSIGQNPPAAAGSLHLYIAHAHLALNAAWASAFQNIIVWLQ